jgi:signal transduction histidine kinase
MSGWRTLRWRLVGLFVILALLSASVFMQGSQRLMNRTFQTLVVPLMGDYVDRLFGELGTPPDVRKAQALVDRLPIQIHIHGPQVQWSSDPDWAEHRLQRYSDPPPESRRRRALQALITRHTADGHTVIFGVDRDRWERGHPWYVWRPILLLVMLTLLTYLVVRWLMHPLQDIRAGTQRFGKGDFGQPIPIRRSDELGDLSHDVNTMAHNLHGMLQGQRSMLLAISHELRSPLTRARLQAELLPPSPEQESLIHELAGMNQMIHDLLSSERMRATAPTLQLHDLNAAVRQAVASISKDEQWPAERVQQIQWTLAENLPPVMLDTARFTLLLRNLLQNAWRYGAAEQHGIALCTELYGNAVQLRLRDWGPGVQPAHIAALGEPFYRPDEARSRAQGGVGLGLYLCRHIAQSMQIALRFENANPGLQVCLQW